MSPAAGHYERELTHGYLAVRSRLRACGAPMRAHAEWRMTGMIAASALPPQPPLPAPMVTVAYGQLPPRPNCALIAGIVARHFGVSVLDLRSQRRTLSAIRPRHAAMLMAREFTTLTLATIGHWFGDSRPHDGAARHHADAGALPQRRGPVRRDRGRAAQDRRSVAMSEPLLAADLVRAAYLDVTGNRVHLTLVCPAPSTAGRVYGDLERQLRAGRLDVVLPPAGVIEGEVVGRS